MMDAVAFWPLPTEGKAPTVTMWVDRNGSLEQVHGAEALAEIAKSEAGSLMVDRDKRLARTSRDREIDIADAIGRLDERVLAMGEAQEKAAKNSEALAVIRHNELQRAYDDHSHDDEARHQQVMDGQSIQIVRVNKIAEELEGLADWVTGFEGTVLDEVKRVDSRIDILTSSTDMRFGQASNELAKLHVAAGGAVQTVWIVRGWRVFWALVGTVVAVSSIAVALHTLGWHL